MGVASLWTAEVDETAFSSWTAGISARETAKAIFKRHGVMVSRNAVIGRAGRKGWKTPAKPTDTTGIAKPRRNRTKTRPNGADGALAVRVAAAQKPPRFPKDNRPLNTSEAVGLNLELLDLPENGCRYPTGENEHRHLFCGHERHGARSYCAAHSRLSYRPLWGRSVA